ncbi:MAG: endolytic transglycosylase MltG [Patescibacteria group bacterium]
MKKIILLLFVIILIGAAAAVYSVYAPNGFSEPAIVNIEAGRSASEIGRALKSQRLIRSEAAFKWYVIISGAAAKLVAGSHEIKAGSSLSSIIAQLTINNNPAEESQLTIVEGWRLKDIAVYLENKNIIGADDFLAAAEISCWRNRYDFLSDPKIKSLEGFLFPETYNIFRAATADDIIKKLLAEFNGRVTASMRSDLQKQNHSLLEAVTLASIIEREISNQPEADSDRKIVADIFWKRLEIGMGLQSDATVNYITGKTSTRPTFADLEIDSPYNTYKYRGLPPGPINNPSLASLIAVIYPTPNDYYYFLTDEGGRAYFAETYSGHQQNIIKYLDNN